MERMDVMLNIHYVTNCFSVFSYTAVNGIGWRADDYTGSPRRNAPNFRRVFLMLNYTYITQNTYVQS